MSAIKSRETTPLTDCARTPARKCRRSREVILRLRSERSADSRGSSAASAIDMLLGAGESSPLEHLIFSLFLGRRDLPAAARSQSWESQIGGARPARKHNVTELTKRPRWRRATHRRPSAADGLARPASARAEAASQIHFVPGLVAGRPRLAPEWPARVGAAGEQDKQWRTTRRRPD